MKVGDFVRSKVNDHYGLIRDTRDDDMVWVLWQGMSCNTTWESIHDLVFGVENELMSWGGSQ